MVERPPTGRRIAGAATLIAVLTVASRVAGFGRTLVFNWAVGPGELGDIYLAANAVPNIIFEIVAGGALASLVVPLLAGAVARGDRAGAGATTSALLTWTLALLLPAAALVALGAGPIMEALAGDSSPAQVEAGATMLRVFAIQLPLYGIGIVLTGVLQAHHRFAWPVLAPLLSSVTVIATYLAFAGVVGRGAGLATAGVTGEMILAVGTTLGVAVLTLCLVIPVRRLGLPLRAGFGFHPQARAAVGGLALAGAVTVAAQQVAVVALRLALHGPDGSVVLFNLAQTVYLLPWAVLAVPLATAAYPVLAASASTGDTTRYRDTLAGTVRGVLLLAFLGAATLVALAGPGARLLVAVMAPDADASPAALAASIAWFAPGLVGYGLSAVLTRALYARGDTAVAAGATVTGWAAVALGSVALAAAFPAGQRVVALAVANSAGMTVLGVVLLVAVGRRAGRVALSGVGRAAAVGTLAGVVAGTAGLLVAWPWPATPGAGRALAQGMLCAVVAVSVFVGIAYLVDRRDVRPLVRRLREGKT